MPKKEYTKHDNYQYSLNPKEILSKIKVLVKGGGLKLEKEELNFLKFIFENKISKNIKLLELEHLQLITILHLLMDQLGLLSASECDHFPYVLFRNKKDINDISKITKTTEFDTLNSIFNSCQLGLIYPLEVDIFDSIKIEISFLYSIGKNFFEIQNIIKKDINIDTIFSVLLLESKKLIKI